MGISTSYNRLSPMARIFISYCSSDRELALRLADALKANGHVPNFDVESLAPGQEWRVKLSESLRSSEVFVSLLSEPALTSSFVLSEIGAARAFAQISGEMLVVPVVLDKIVIPLSVRDLQVIIADRDDPGYIVSELERAIDAFTGQRAAAEKRVVEVTERIESNAPRFIDAAIASLQALERRNRVLGSVWYALGFAALLGGVCMAFYSISQVETPNQASWARFATLTLKNIIVVSLLGACAKYAFTLGRSYVAEELKCSDRLHAISFGKFFLQVFGARATWPELKDAFQHWNIDRASSFSTLDASQFDPKLLEAMVEVARLIAARGGSTVK